MTAKKPAKKATAKVTKSKSKPRDDAGTTKKKSKSSLKTTIVDTPPRKTHGEKKAALRQPEGPVLKGMRSVIYQVPPERLDEAKAFYITITGKAPYFDQPYYVGFDVNGIELGLDPDISVRQPGPAGAIAYWRVDKLAASFPHVVTAGALSVEEPHDVGGGIQVAIVSDPFGNLVGLIEMP